MPELKKKTFLGLDTATMPTSSETIEHKIQQSTEFTVS